MANAYCERVIGSLRRECLDYFIPVHETHLRRTVREWVRHYNAGRPHSSLGPGIPNEAAKLSNVVELKARCPSYLSCYSASTTVFWRRSTSNGLEFRWPGQDRVMGFELDRTVLKRWMDLAP